MTSNSTPRHHRAVHTLALSLSGGALVMAAALPAQAAQAAPASVPAVSQSNATAGALMSLPVEHFRLSARFGDGGGNWSSGQHTGLDFADPVGTPVFAPMDGKVISAGPEGPYGNSILIQHADGLKTRYGHLNKILVKKGEVVTRGQLIGKVGSTGNSTGPHLHFEVIKNNKPVNPEKYLWIGKAPARG